MDRKLENEYKIQDIACGRSGVMLCLKLVKSSAEAVIKDNTDNDNNNANILYGTQFVKQLIKPWFNFTNRVLCANSVFASVGCAVKSKRLSMRFIVAVKTATRKCSMQWLSQVDMSNCSN